MRNLIEFLIKYSSAFLFALLFVVSLLMLFSNGRYHSSIWFTSANAVSNQVYSSAKGITDYFNLRSINRSLQESNARLENEVLNLRTQLANYRSYFKDTVDLSGTKRFDYVMATVLNNSTRHPRNYITIDKGEKDGIKAGMGVVDQSGIVGIVNIAGRNSSRIISVLNATQRISVRLKGTELVGSLVWKYNDPKVAYMVEVPRHSKYAKGDTVVTSGYSTSFPADIPVGIIEGRVKGDNDNYYTLKVRLAGDFNNLTMVRVLNDRFKEEVDSLKNYDIQN